MPRYNAARGGHAPGHLREWFEEFVEAGQIADEMHENKLTTDWLLGQLWNCRDIMPSGLCQQLHLAAGSTYAKATRHLKRH